MSEFIFILISHKIDAYEERLASSLQHRNEPEIISPGVKLGSLGAIIASYKAAETRQNNLSNKPLNGSKDILIISFVRKPLWVSFVHILKTMCCNGIWIMMNRRIFPQLLIVTFVMIRYNWNNINQDEHYAAKYIWKEKETTYKAKICAR